MILSERQIKDAVKEKAQAPGSCAFFIAHQIIKGWAGKLLHYHHFRCLRSAGFFV